jgi:hypothetical protein
MKLITQQSVGREDKESIFINSSSEIELLWLSESDLKGITFPIT